MSRVLEQVVAWLEEGHRVALASVSAVHGSTPRPTGPAMAVRDDGVVAGSVSVGCVDGETYALAEEVLRSGLPSSRTYAGPQEQAGLPTDLGHLGPSILCGGSMTVQVEALPPQDAPRLRQALAFERAADPLLLVYGAGDLAAEICRLGTTLGRRVVVCDPRPVFTTPDRFPEAWQVVVDQPHRHLDRLLRSRDVDVSTAVVALTHDERTEDPLLQVALGCPAGYVGALGSRATHRARLERLRTLGVDGRLLSRLRGPAGLDLGGTTAAETALSILAEILAVANGRAGTPLSHGSQAIHPRRADSHPRATASLAEPTGD
ncbi:MULTISPECIES: XdhC family protein [Arsenicicoccus]|uniref:XdhC family protein n=1 Tax=Arsenicicoccus TaxID=267408 RepID=UPI00257BE1E9|nr:MULTISPECIES: XdhC/CoxI family protein [Arsenicicoccus]